MIKLNLSIRYGIFIGIVNIVYFLFLALLDTYHYPLYNIGAILIFGVGQFLLISTYKKHCSGVFKYEKGFWVLFQSGIIATAIFTFFMVLYVTELDTEFIKNHLSFWENDEAINPGSIALALILMGSSISLIFSLTHMQFFKRSWNTKEGKEHTL